MTARAQTVNQEISSQQYPSPLLAAEENRTVISIISLPAANTPCPQRPGLLITPPAEEMVSHSDDSANESDKDYFPRPNEIAKAPSESVNMCHSPEEEIVAEDQDVDIVNMMDEDDRVGFTSCKAMEDGDIFKPSVL
jgi:hypothetical protein